MKTLFLLALFAPALGAFSSPALAQNGSKILVAYFSWSGNSAALAEQVIAATGADRFEIKTVAPYPNTYDECIDVAKKEQNDNARPAILGGLTDVGRYDVIILCYPNWWGTMPMGVFTFLESYDFSGKTIYPVVTHGGSRFGSSLADIKRLCPNAVVGDGVEVSAFDRNPSNPPTVKTPNSAVTKWLGKLGLNG
jgi:flavodoxin